MKYHAFSNKFIVIGILLLFFPKVAFGLTNYIYPLDSWTIKEVHGEEISKGVYHMGIDAGYELNAGDPVYAAADGIVKEAKVRSRFGLVVLIEHQPEKEDRNVTLYGHLRPSDVRVYPGQHVKAGDVIGVLGEPYENGGWNVHLHFGIHKQPYSNIWIYYGHVRDVNIQNDWYDPALYIPTHLTSDNWDPKISWDLIEGKTVGDNLEISTTARDIGSGVKSIKYKASDDDGETWQTLSDAAISSGVNTATLDMHDLADGNVIITAVVRDYFNNKNTNTNTITKNAKRFNVPAFITMKGKESSGQILQWSIGNDVLSNFLPFSDTWSKGGDIAVGDINGDSSSELASINGSTSTKSIVKITTTSGLLLNSFTAFSKGAARIALGDINGDGQAEIIVGSGKKQQAKVKAFKRNGELIWEITPFNGEITSGLDVATGDINNDGIDEAIVGTRSGAKTRIATIKGDGSRVIKRFKPFKEKFKGGANVTAGDINGDGKAEIVVGSESQRVGRVRVFTGRGEKTGISIYPFGTEFKGSVDVSTLEWDEEPFSDEIVMSQASQGESWVKVYRTDADKTVLFNQRAYEADYEGGSRVAGWK
ncbi:MAG: VCBS repeat domain-containing M23 family metallopeptidase [bacterium]|nr:VCBS repeat domain-containing M23 family metallopeptidase [bacterium]